ncbi:MULTISPECIES: hypothetical protein [unclassified Luteibacter]|uniref:hypothetical protein n=1 Tax=Luteibacter sp. PvP019 TaxID=3156436 RepID=UPI003392E9D8
MSSSTTSWYVHDGANRVTVSDGDLVGGAASIAGRSTSYGLGNDSAGNDSVRTTVSGTAILVKRSVYDERGQLSWAD